MNRFIFGVLLFTCVAGLVMDAAAAEQSLASTLNVYVFPSQGQAADQQSQDEAACYQWAVQNSGVDPFELAKQQEQQQQQAAAQQQQAQSSVRGSGVRGAVGGAATGALIGEIADDDAGEGAAYGAAAGAIMGRRSAKRSQRQASEQAQQQAQQAQSVTSQERTNFNNAFSVCLEGKGYLVKF
ncbi:MAG: glycine zipper domain-containing protein [Pseudomonadales bacterium]